MARGPEVDSLLVRALAASAAAAGCALAIGDSRATHWESATFSGARHRILATATGSAALEAWLITLPELEFAIQGHFVADVTIAEIDRHEGAVIVTIEALTLVAA